VKQTVIEPDVQHRGRIAPEAAPLDSDCGADLVDREALLGHVAHRAGHRAIARQPPIHEQLAAERDLLRGMRAGIDLVCGQPERGAVLGGVNRRTCAQDKGDQQY
jgi:hypothetical protein